MKLASLSGRCVKEILRDRLNLAFGLGFPLALLLLLTAIQANIPVPLFALTNLAPGIVVFGLSFFTLFAAVLVAKDRESAFLQRLYTAPLTAAHFIAGYLLPLLPVALLQSGLCYGVAVLLGLPATHSILSAIALNLPTALFFIALGLLCGSVLTSKQAGGVCGALLTNLTAWLSGIWFDLDLVGGAFAKIAHCLPFFHATELQRAALNAPFSSALPHLSFVTASASLLTLLATLLFLHQMKRQ